MQNQIWIWPKNVSVRLTESDTAKPKWSNFNNIRN